MTPEQEKSYLDFIFEKEQEKVVQRLIEEGYPAEVEKIVKATEIAGVLVFGPVPARELGQKRVDKEFGGVR